MPAGLAGPKLGPDGYRRIKVGGRTYLAHRLAWVLHYGEWPSQRIDHINGVRHDNRIANLRLCTNSQNVAHQFKARVSASGLRGVYPERGRWCSKIVINYQPHYLGSFSTKEAAADAYRAAAIKHFGDFAAPISIKR